MPTPIPSIQEWGVFPVLVLLYVRVQGYMPWIPLAYTPRQADQRFVVWFSGSSSSSRT